MKRRGLVLLMDAARSSREGTQASVKIAGTAFKVNPKMLNMRSDAMRLVPPGVRSVKPKRSSKSTGGFTIAEMTADHWLQIELLAYEMQVAGMFERNATRCIVGAFVEWLAAAEVPLVYEGEDRTKHLDH